MKTTETIRETAVRRVMRTVARRRRSDDMVKDQDGRFPIIVALPDDTVEHVESQRLRLGGVANLFVAYPDKLVMLEITDDDGGDADPADVHPGATIEMVLAWIRQKPTQSGTIHIGIAVAQDMREMEYSL